MPSPRPPTNSTEETELVSQSRLGGIKFYLVASRGIGYGMTTFRVDGNDLLAVFNTVKKARELCLQDGKTQPVLIEMISYRYRDARTCCDA